MLRHVTGRIGQYVLVVTLALAINFVLPRAMPGSPLATLAGEEAGQMTQAQRVQVLEEYGLDQPLPVQFADYLTGVARGDLGRSFRDGQPVAAEILDRLPWTLLLVGSALVITTLVGVVLGVRSGAVREHKRDTKTLAVFLTMDSLPPFWVGMLLIVVFGVWLGVLPTFGATTLGTEPGLLASIAQIAEHLTLPLVTLSIAGLGQTFLITRYSMLSVMGQEYMLLARAKGLPRRRLLRRHAFRNAALPVHTLVMLEIGYIVSGSVVVETVFAYPGLGRLLFQALLARDFPVMQGTFLILVLTVIGMNFLADVTYPLLDPRVRRPAAEVGP